MKKSRKFMLSGVVVAALSCLLGIGGMIWNISASFDSLERSESAGIGAVGVDIERALIFTVVSIVGLLIGILLIIFGAVSYRKGE